MIGRSLCRQSDLCHQTRRFFDFNVWPSRFNFLMVGLSAVAAGSVCLGLYSSHSTNIHISEYARACCDGFRGDVLTDLDGMERGDIIQFECGDTVTSIWHCHLVPSTYNRRRGWTYL